MEQVFFVTRPGEGLDANVMLEIDRGHIDPHRRPQTETGSTQNLAKAGQAVQSAPDVLAESVDSNRAIGFEQPLALDDCDQADGLTPPCILRSEHGKVGRGETLQDRSSP
jgi:hypothetical protein